MTESEFKQAVLAQWESVWNPLHLISSSDPQYVPYTYTNEDFETDALGALGAWARVTILHTTRQQITMGSSPHRKYECRGNVFVQLFAPAGQEGSLLLSSLADDARTALEGLRLLDCVLHEGRTEEGAEDGVRTMVSVIFPFRYVETR